MHDESRECSSCLSLGSELGLIAIAVDPSRTADFCVLRVRRLVR